MHTTAGTKPDTMLRKHDSHTSSSSLGPPTQAMNKEVQAWRRRRVFQRNIPVLQKSLLEASGRFQRWQATQDGKVMHIA